MVIWKGVLLQLQDIFNPWLKTPFCHVKSPIMDPNTKMRVLHIRWKTEWEPKCPIPKVIMFCIECPVISVNPVIWSKMIVLFSWKPIQNCQIYIFWENGACAPLPLRDLQIPLGNVSFVVGVFCSKCTHSLMYFQDTNNWPWLSWRK